MGSQQGGNSERTHIVEVKSHGKSTGGGGEFWKPCKHDIFTPYLKHGMWTHISDFKNLIVFYGGQSGFEVSKRQRMKPCKHNNSKIKA